jgi:hypothetical protein
MPTPANALNESATGLQYFNGTATFTGIPWSSNLAWTPTVRGSTTAGTPTYVFQQGLYGVLGSAGAGIVWASFNVDASLAGSAGLYQIGGFPFAPAVSTNYNAQGVVWTNLAPPAGTISVSLALISGGTVAQILSLGGNAYFSTSTGTINTIGTIFYFI